MKDDRKPEDIPDPRPSSTRLGRTDGNSTRRKKKQAARDRLEEIQAVEDPVMRIKQLAIFFRRGPGRNITSDLDMETFLDAAQAQAFEEIRATSKEADDARSYLKDILFETDPKLIDDYTWGWIGLVERVRRKVETLMEHYSDDTIPSDVFSTERQREHAETVVEAHDANWRDIDDMTALIKHAGETPVKKSQEVLREAGIPYEHGNPQDFVRVLEQALDAGS